MVFMGKQLASEDIRGKTVAIIGGGPAGCATAIPLARLPPERGLGPRGGPFWGKGLAPPPRRPRLSRERGLGLRVVLFEGKDFERHYNQCAGVLSPPIEELLQCRLDIELPYEIFKRQIFGYRLHTGGREILLVGPHRGGATYAVRRVVFDRFLLAGAEKEGVEVRWGPTSRISL